MPYRKHVKEERAEDEAGTEEQRAPHRYSALVEWPALALVFVAPLAIGTVHVWSSGLVLALALLSFGALVLRRRRKARSFLLFPVGVALLGACALVALQLVPLPSWLHRLLSHTGDDLSRHLREGTRLGEEGWWPLSLSAPATAAELMRLLACALGFIVAVNYFNDRQRARRMLKAVSICGFLVAVVALLSKLFSLPGVFGLFPGRGGEHFFGTFVNPNHQAAFLALTSLVSFGLTLSGRERQGRMFFAAMGLFSGVGVFLTLSRGGMVAYLAGLMLMIVIVATRQSLRLRRVALVQGLAAGLVLLAGYLAYDTIVRELRTLGDVQALREENKIQAWRGALSLMADYPVLGVGKGAYAAAYTRYKSVESGYTYTHAENELLQVMTDLGPLPGLALAGVFVLAFVLSFRRMRQSMSLAGVVVGVFAVGGQNLVDFNLETGGVAVPFVLLVGIMAASPFSHAGQPAVWEVRPRLGGRLAMALVPLVLVLGLGCFAYASAHELGRCTERLLEAAEQPPAEPCAEGRLGQAACDMLRYHPADFLAPLVLGKAYLRPGPGRKMDRAAHWLSRALFLNPSCGTAHRLLGRALFWAGHREQALVEYRAAATYQPELLTAATTEVLRLTGDAEAAIQATPPGAKNYLAVARNLRVLGDPKAAARAAQLALEQDGTMVPALDLLAEMALADSRLEEAQSLARRTLDLDPLHAQAYLTLGAVRSKAGDAAGAEKAWLDGFEQIPDSAQLAYRLVELYLSQGRLAQAEQVASRLQSIAPSDQRSQARLAALLGRIHESKGMLYDARRDFESAAVLDSGYPGYRLEVARLAERMGNFDEAERIYRQLEQEGFRPEEMRKRLESLAQARRKSMEDAMREVWLKKEAGAKEGQPPGVDR